jgi:hypothetical protein
MAFEMVKQPFIYLARIYALITNTTVSQTMKITMPVTIISARDQTNLTVFNLISCRRQTTKNFQA